MNKRILALLFVIAIASGCINGDIGPSTASGEGLVVEDFKVSDEQISVGQQVSVDILLRNYHVEETDIEDISLFNTGDLEVSERVCTPDPDQLRSMRDDVVPEMECNWVLETDGLEDFEQKNIPVSLNLEYETAMRSEPIQVHFRPLSDIDRTNTVERSFSNGEIAKSISTESPIPHGQEGVFEVSVEETGPGTVEGESYSFEYSPSEVFENCEEEYSEVGFLFDSNVEFSCGIETDGGDSEVTRNLHLTTHYKYVKQPSVDIQVVNR